MKNRLKKFLPTIYKYLTVVISIGIAFVYGTFQPNSIVKHKIVSTVEADVVETAHSFGLHEPQFEYNNEETFIETLKVCIDYINFKTAPSKRIPSAIIIGMAGIETGWGTSRFAIQGNNLFGIRTWDPDTPQLKPLELPNARFGVKIYKTKCASVQDMIDTINRHTAYKEFRKERAIQYDSSNWDYKKLLKKLHAWSTNPKYADIVFDAIITRQIP